MKGDSSARYNRYTYVTNCGDFVSKGKENLEFEGGTAAVAYLVIG
jgi:hypothetical protein